MWDGVERRIVRKLGHVEEYEDRRERAEERVHVQLPCTVTSAHKCSHSCTYTCTCAPGEAVDSGRESSTGLRHQLHASVKRVYIHVS